MIHTIFWHLEFCIGRYTLEITDGQSWSNYMGPKRDISQVCLTRPVFTHFSLKVAWSGISLIGITVQHWILWEQNFVFATVS